MRIIPLLLLVIFMGACKGDVHTAKEVQMFNASGDMVGTAKLSEQSEGVQIKIKIEGLTPGFHGIHVHEYGKCEGPDFKSSGNHLNPDGKEHGLMHPEGAHLGDLPNILADEKGEVDAELELAEATLLSGKKSILEGEGTSLIVTADQDDGVSQPGGDSGERIICGIIADEEELIESPTDPTETDNENEEEI